jgi:hypothetical protein
MSDARPTDNDPSGAAPVSASSGRPGLLRPLAHRRAGDTDVLPAAVQGDRRT